MSHDAARLTGKTAWIICLSPDVCNTPVGSSVVPIPYMIASKLEWGKQTVSNVRLGGEQAFTWPAELIKWLVMNLARLEMWLPGSIKDGVGHKPINPPAS